VVKAIVQGGVQSIEAGSLGVKLGVLYGYAE